MPRDKSTVDHNNCVQTLLRKEDNNQITRSLKRLGKKQYLTWEVEIIYQDFIVHHCWGTRQGEITLTILLYPDQTTIYINLSLVGHNGSLVMFKSCYCHQATGSLLGKSSSFDIIQGKLHKINRHNHTILPAFLVFQRMTSCPWKRSKLLIETT